MYFYQILLHFFSFLPFPLPLPLFLLLLLLLLLLYLSFLFSFPFPFPFPPLSIKRSATFLSFLFPVFPFPFAIFSSFYRTILRRKGARVRIGYHCGIRSIHIEY